MRLADLMNFMCVGVVLFEYVEGNPEGKEIYRCHSLDIPINYYDRIVMALAPFDEDLYILLESEK